MENSESRLADLLDMIFKGEARVERSRQELTRSPDFNPYASFNLLDHLSIRSINASDFQKLLSSHGLSAPTAYLKQLVKQYDSDNDERLNILDFFELILPSENSELRETAEKRRSKLNAEVIRTLASHIYLECLVQANISEYRQRLHEIPNWNNSELFKRVSLSGNEFISKSDLAGFLHRHKVFLSDTEIDSLIRRIDSDRDKLLSFNDFSEIIKGKKTESSRVSLSPIRSSSTRITSPISIIDSYQSPINSYSPFLPQSPLQIQDADIGQKQSFATKDQEDVLNLSSINKHDPIHNSSSILKNSSISYIEQSPCHFKQVHVQREDFQPISNYYLQNPLESHKNNRDRVSSSQKRDYEAELIQRNSYFQNQNYPQALLNNRSSSKDLTKRPSTGLINNSLNTIYEFSEFLKSQIAINRNIETIIAEFQASLGQRTSVAFKIIDFDNKGYILMSDLKKFLSSIRASYNNDDIYLIFRQFSSEQNLRIREKDLDSIFKTNEIAPDNLQVSAETRVKIIDETGKVLRAMINSERAAEELRTNFTSKRWVKHSDIFKHINKTQDGFIYIDELEEFLNGFGEFPSLKDLEKLMDRFDKDQDGKISYGDFLQEIAPKLV